MAETINAHCELCGKGYNVCRRCDKDNTQAWKVHCDTAEHYKIYQIVRGNYLGIYTDEEAAKKLENVDLSDFKDFREDVKAAIKKIQKAKSVQSKEPTKQGGKFFKKDKDVANETPDVKDVAGVVTDIVIENK